MSRLTTPGTPNRTYRLVAGLMLTIAMAAGTGCQSMQRIFYQAGSAPSFYTVETVDLAVGGDPGEPRLPTSTAPAQAFVEGNTTTRPTTQPPVRLPYTAPTVGLQRMSLIAAAALGALPEMSGAGREVSESLAPSSTLVIGRRGVAAPPSVFGTAIPTRRGIQEGPATGLGFASPVNNIFRPRVNRMTGPGGRCEELARAGFFGGSRQACEQCLLSRCRRR